MADKKVSLDKVIAKEMPGFRVVKDAEAEGPVYGSDAVTPSLATMQAKYKTAGASAPVPEVTTPEPPTASKAQMVVVESETEAQRSDAPGKRLTVLVKDGKIRARQG